MRYLLIALLAALVATTAYAEPPTDHDGSGTQSFVLDHDFMIIETNPDVTEYRRGTYYPATVDAISEATDTEATVLAWNHTTDEDANLLIVHCFATDNLATGGVTYDSVAMTSRYSTSNMNQVWTLVDPADGVNEIAVSFGANEQDEIACKAVSMFNATVAEVAEEATGTGTGASVMADTLAHYDTIIDFLYVSDETAVAVPINPDQTPVGPNVESGSTNGLLGLSIRHPVAKIPAIDSGMGWGWVSTHSWRLGALTLRPTMTWTGQAAGGWETWAAPYTDVTTNLAETDKDYFFSLKVTDMVDQTGYDELRIPYVSVPTGITCTDGVIFYHPFENANDPSTTTTPQGCWADALTIASTNMSYSSTDPQSGTYSIATSSSSGSLVFTDAEDLGLDEYSGTVSFYVYFPSTPGEWNQLIRIGQTADANKRLAVATRGVTGELEFHYRNSNGTTALNSTACAIAAEEWVYIQASWQDSSPYFSLTCREGVDAETVTHTTDPNFNDMPFDDITVGGSGLASGVKIDNVIIYSSNQE